VTAALNSLLAAGRREHEALMVDRVRLFRVGEPVFDQSSGVETPGAETVFYLGKARVKPLAQSSGDDVEAGEQELVLREYEVALPWSTVIPGGGRILPGDRVAVEASSDVRMVGLTLWVVSTQFSATATAWRIVAEDRS